MNDAAGVVELAQDVIEIEIAREFFQLLIDVFLALSDELKLGKA